MYDGDEAKLKKIFDQEYSLQEFVSPGNFKSYDVLKTRLNKVLGLDGTELPKTKAETNTITDDEASSFNTAEIAEEDDLNHFKDLVNN